ncbi:hypothetical protein [Streptomyces sp. NPDC018045]|uniref:hypothetical protein n=1 Tax=Streptomyces sp. NPDC018045 TaxID=3365037 RepID=UPI0037933A92
MHVVHQKGQGGAPGLGVSLSGRHIDHRKDRIRLLDAVAGMWRRRLERDEFPCHDCGLLTAPLDGPDEWYTVLDSVWERAGADEESVLCVGCLEVRLDRRLRPTDFVTAALNDPDYGRHSKRLLSRLRPPGQG